MAIPYFADFGEGNVFRNDFYAKRIMTLFAFPFFSLIIFFSLKKKKLAINKNIIAYLFIYSLISIISIIKGNKLTLIITDAFIAALPVFFYFLVFKTKFKISSYEDNFNLLLIIASITVVLGVKLQFSYFTLIAVIYIIFLIKWNTTQVVLLIFLPILLMESLIGKSALIMLVFMIAYFFLFDKYLVSRQKKIYLLLIPSVLAILLTVTFWDKIQNTGSYRNLVYFIKNTDFSNLSFKDNSTGHRLFEAERVVQEFKKEGIATNFFGNGFGTTIDLSNTPDITVTKANEDISNVRNIHMGIFAVLHRYGVIGLLIYLAFICKMLLVCRRTLKRERHPAIILSALYILLLLFDSLISFPHMMSNFLFWLMVFVLIKDDKDMSYSTKVN